MRQLNRVRCTLLAAFCVRQRRRIIPQDIAKETKLQQRAAVLAHTHTRMEEIITDGDAHESNLSAVDRGVMHGQRKDRNPCINTSPYQSPVVTHSAPSTTMYERGTFPPYILPHGQGRLHCRSIGTNAPEKN